MIDSPLFDYFAVIGYNPIYGLRVSEISITDLII